MRSFLTIAALSAASACSDYEIASISPEELSSDEEVEVDSACQQDRSAFIQADVVSLGQDAWTPGWNTVAEFTLTTDKDTCFDTTFELDFTSTDDGDTDWNSCEEYVDQDHLRIFYASNTDGILQELEASWAFQGATGDNGAYVHSCDPGRFIVNAIPVFVDEDTTILASDPLTFVITMEAQGSTDPEDRMKVDLLWDDSSQVDTNSGNLHQREGSMLPFVDRNE